MKAICKRSYPYDDYEYDISYRLNIQLFKADLLYTYKTYYIENELFYRVGDYNEIFMKEEFEDYFKTLAQARKEKLKKLNYG